MRLIYSTDLLNQLIRLTSKAVILLLLNVVLAQADESSVSGLAGCVYDQTVLRSIADVKVVAKNLSSEKEFSTKTDETGKFKLKSLLPGKYDLYFQKAGFQYTKVTNINLTVSFTTGVHIALQPGNNDKMVEIDFLNSPQIIDPINVGGYLEWGCDG